MIKAKDRAKLKAQIICRKVLEGKVEKTGGATLWGFETSG